MLPSREAKRSYTMKIHTMRFRVISTFSVLVFYLCVSLPAFSQVDSGGIRGTVKDRSGAVVSGAKVTLTNEDTSLTTETVTSDDGNYSFTPIKIGTYTLEVELQGFQKETQRHTQVEVQQQVKADFVLVPGSISQSVEVTAVAPLLQTQDASVANLATSAQINNLPLNGRNYTFLSQLGPGVTGLSATRGLDQSGSFVANGLTTVHNNYILDGIDNNNDTVDYLNGAAYVNLPPPDAIQEFKVQTSNFSAEFGRAGGAVLNASIKSGTNQLHGSAWEFLRNEKLDAADLYFVDRAKTNKGALRQNQFGASAGGPVIKKKTFIFGDYDGRRIRQGALRNPTVPTDLQRNSGFTDYRDVLAGVSGTKSDLLGRTFPAATIFDPATTRPVSAAQVDPVTGLLATSNGFVRDPFYTGGSIVGITDFTGRTQFLNQLPASRLDPNVIKLLNLYPSANQAGIFNNYSANRSQPDDSNHFDIRADQDFSQRDQLFGRVSYTRRHANFPGDFVGLGDNAGFGQGDFKDNSVNLAISETHSFSATMINEFRFGYSRLRTSSEPPITGTAGIPAQFGIQGIPQDNGNGGLPTISIGGLTSLGAGAFASPNRRVSDTIQFTENLTKTHGAHSFKGGFEYQSVHFPWIDPAWSRGSFSFGGYTGIPNGVSGGVGTADILLTPVASTVPGGVDFVGGSNAVFASNITQPDDLRRYYGTYFQDDWKVTSKLTLNLGLRWEVFGQIEDINGKQANLIPGAPNGAGAEYLLLNSQKSQPLSPSFTSLLAKDGIKLQYIGDSSVSTTPLTNFAPRIGLAYQLTPKFVTRAGYGIFYGGFENVGGAPDPGYTYPYAVNLAFFRKNDVSPLVYPNGQRATLEAGLSAANPDPASPNFDAHGLGLLGFERPWKTAYTQQWNLAFQYQLTPSQTVTLAYVGNSTHHMLDGDKRNVTTEILPPGTDPQQFVPFPDFSRNSDYVAPNGDAYYHGVSVALERRFSQGLNLLVNYTRSACKTDNKNILGISENDFARAPLLPGFGLKRDYRYCGNDVPNIFRTSGIWQVPIGKGHRLAGNASGFVNQAIGGWSAQWIYTLQDGFPFTVGCATPTTSNFGCTAFVVSGQNLYAHSGPHGINQFLNPAAFSNPPVATTIGQTDYSPLGGQDTQVHGPGYDNLDFSLFKQFPTSESTHLEFRSEFFNFLNHPNFSNSFRTLNFTDTQNFARINGTRGIARQIQLGLKFYW
jgi:hypothetical protein